MIKTLSILIAIVSISTCPASDQRCAACNGVNCLVCYDSFLGTNGRCRVSTIEVNRCL